MSEPIFHFFDDCLPETDLRAYTSIRCCECGDLVHASNNETMQAWLETGIGSVCLDCFYGMYTFNPSLEEPWPFDKLQKTMLETVDEVGRLRSSLARAERDLRLVSEMRGSAAANRILDYWLSEEAIARRNMA